MEPETQIFLIKMIVFGLLMAILVTLCFWVFECILFTKKETSTQINVFLANGTNDVAENGVGSRGRNGSGDDASQRSWMTVSETTVDLGEETDAGFSLDAPPPSYEECMKILKVNGQK